jgi:hypothetical protein
MPSRRLLLQGKWVFTASRSILRIRRLFTPSSATSTAIIGWFTANAHSAGRNRFSNISAAILTEWPFPTIAWFLSRMEKLHSPGETVRMETFKKRCHYPQSNSCVGFCFICFQRALYGFAISDFLRADTGVAYCRFVSSVSDLTPRHSITKLGRKIQKAFASVRNAALL